MGNRSNISLVGNTTYGTNVNVGSGAGVYICKGNGNELLFKSICATGGSIQIFNCACAIYISGKTGGGGGSLSTANNGLTVHGSNVVLGGLLTGDTCIDANSKLFCIWNASSILLGGCGAGSSLTLGNNITDNTYLCGNNSVSLCSPQISISYGTNAYIYDNAGTPVGLRYGGNYRANFLCDSLVDAAWVTGHTGGVTGATNLGSGDGTIYTSTSNKNIQLKTLSGGTNVTLTCNGNYIGINAVGGSSGIGWSNLANGSTVAGCSTVPSGATICNNTFYGVCAGSSITIGEGNVAVGYRALKNNQTGCNNTALGINALLKNISGNDNFGSGYYTMNSNTIGSDNIAIGYEAFCNNICGSNNIGLGYQALTNNISGNTNIGIGCLALNNNIGGCSNIALGAFALANNTYGCNNIANGCRVLQGNTIGGDNIAIGKEALKCNITGSSNIAIGHGAGYYETGSSKLYIANCCLCSLIYGEFDTKMVKIDGCMCITALPAKTTETCGIYIDSIGKLSYGVISGGTGGGITGATNLGSGNGTLYTTVSGNKLNLKTLSGGTNVTLTCNGNYIGINTTAGTVITGTTSYIPKFNATGNNICNSSIFDSGTTNICILKSNLSVGALANTCTIIKANDNASSIVHLVLQPGCRLDCTACDGFLYLNPGRGVPYHALYIGSPTFTIPNVFLQPEGTSASMSFFIASKGNSGVLDLAAGCSSYVLLGACSSQFYVACGGCITMSNDCNVIIRGYNNPTVGSAGRNVTICAGSSVAVSGNSCGGCVLLRSGTGLGTGFTGTIILSGETEVINGTCNYLYLGNKNTDGSWRFVVSGSSLVVQTRVSSVWTCNKIIAP